MCVSFFLATGSTVQLNMKTVENEAQASTVVFISRVVETQLILDFRGQLQSVFKPRLSPLPPKCFGQCL